MLRSSKASEAVASSAGSVVSDLTGCLLDSPVASRPGRTSNESPVTTIIYNLENSILSSPVSLLGVF